MCMVPWMVQSSPGSMCLLATRINQCLYPSDNVPLSILGEIPCLSTEARTNNNGWSPLYDPYQSKYFINIGLRLFNNKIELIANGHFRFAYRRPHKSWLMRQACER
jgi:hypothetical protein